MVTSSPSIQPDITGKIATRPTMEEKQLEDVVNFRSAPATPAPKEEGVERAAMRPPPTSKRMSESLSQINSCSSSFGTTNTRTNSCTMHHRLERRAPKRFLVLLLVGGARVSAFAPPPGSPPPPPILLPRRSSALVGSRCWSSAPDRVLVAQHQQRCGSPTARAHACLFHNLRRRTWWGAVPAPFLRLQCHIDSTSEARGNRRKNVQLSAVSSPDSSSADVPSDPDDAITQSRSTRWSRWRTNAKGSSSPSASSYQWTSQNLAIALPALIGMLADPLLSLVDTVYVGRVGSTELAALGACTSIFHLAFNAFRATTAATTSLVANALTSDDNEAREVTWLSIQLGWWMGVAVLAGLLAFGQGALACMGVSHDSALFRPACDYLFARCWAAPIVLLITVAEGAFRGYANTVVPLLASGSAAVLNLVLDPLLMFRPGHWGVAGAAAATAISQVGAALVYAYHLIQKGMLPPLFAKQSGATTSAAERTSRRDRRRAIIRSILGANFSMMVKQGSLLLGWAFATASATRLGSHHVAAHQVALSVWLVFALIMDGAAVSAQVLMSRAFAAKDLKQATSLIFYMTKFALLQGGLSMLVLDGLDLAVPRIFTPDLSIQAHLHTVMPHLATQQILVSLTLVVESLAAGANQFGLLAAGTAISTVAAVWQIGLQTSVDGIWSLGITTLFAGRLLTAVMACLRARHQLALSDLVTEL